MTPQELEDLFVPIWGKHGWQLKLAEYSKYTTQQINRLARGRGVIKESVANYFRLLAKDLT